MGSDVMAMRYVRLPLLPSTVVIFVTVVMDVAYSPTGTEFVSASYDRTVRIFSVDKGHSRCVRRSSSLCQPFLLPLLEARRDGYLVTGRCIIHVGCNVLCVYSGLATTST
jgi:WD40 repeat protein